MFQVYHECATAAATHLPHLNRHSCADRQAARSVAVNDAVGVSVAGVVRVGRAGRRARLCGAGLLLGSRGRSLRLSGTPHSRGGNVVAPGLDGEVLQAVTVEDGLFGVGHGELEHAGVVVGIVLKEAVGDEGHV